jgi:hypothetical protein
MSDPGKISDGHHTIGELYEHRHALFIALCRQLPSWAWRSRLHTDGTMFDGWFVMGLYVNPGDQVSYHLPIELWGQTDFAKTLDREPKWDGHSPYDVIERLYTI